MYEARPQSILPKLWVTDGTVNTIARSGNTIYLGGSFRHVGPDIAFGIPVSKHSGKPDLRFVMPNGSVYAAVPDGNGGWYIGGTFSAVGGQERQMLARINADGSLHPWNPGIGGFSVSCLAIANGKLYVAGSFQIAAGEQRSQLASFDLATGQLSSWNANLHGYYINAIAIQGNTMYVAGGFWAVGGVARINLAAIDINTGLATAWNPIGDDLSIYNKLAVHGNTVIIGGKFSSLAGQARMNLGAVNATTGQATNWDPSPDGEVYSLLVDDHTLFVGGRFNSIAHHSRSYLASFNLNTFIMDSWKPQLNGAVSAIAENDGKIYVSGGFTLVNEKKRNYVASFYPGSGRLTSFHVPQNNNGRAIAFNNNSVYLTGGSSIIGGEPRRNIAAIDANTGCLLPWNPGANDYYVNHLMVANKQLFVAGSFDTIGGQARGYLASFDLKSGRLTSWNPGATGGRYGDDAPGSVEKMAMHGNTVFFMGSYTRVGGVPRTSLAAVDATTGALEPFNPFIQGTDLYEMAIANGRLYISGFFSEIAGQARTALASFDLATNQLTSWSPVVKEGRYNGRVAAITAINNTIFIGGSFYEVNGQPNGGLAAIDGITGVLKDWIPGTSFHPDNTLYELETDGVNLYVGAASMNPLAVLDATTGAWSDFHPLVTNPNGTGDFGTIFSILPYGNKIYIGGDFTSVDNQPRSSFAGFDMQPSQPRFLYFTSRLEQHANHTWVNVKWGTTNDHAISHFFVERSADNLHFHSVKRIQASQNLFSSHFYDFKDLDPLPATSYYRIKMVGKDNREWLSETERVHTGNGCRVQVYPSPADRMVTVNIEQFAASRVNMVLHNQDGLPVWSRANFTLNNGSGQVQIPVHGLMDGYYVLRISSGTTVETRAVFVQH